VIHPTKQSDWGILTLLIAVFFLHIGTKLHNLRKGFPSTPPAMNASY
jgi:hypothetical protein